MKVALISYHTFSQPGGVKRHILGLQKEFQRKGIRSKIIAPRRKRTEDYGKDVILSGTSFPLSFSGSQSDFAVNFNPLAMEQVLKKEKFDVLHFHNLGFPSSFQTLERSEALNVLTFHASLEGNKSIKNFPISFIFPKIIEKMAQWKIDGIIGVAPLTLKVFKNYSGPKIVIPNGIDLEIFNPKVPRLEKFNDDKINILFLGRIEERKGLIYLLKAYKVLQERFNPPPKYGGGLRLIVVGEGPLKSGCQNWARKNRLKNVVFQGRAKDSEIPSYYRSCDIFCSPAIFGESFGLVLVEAMACQKPVIAFANAGYKGVLTGKGAQFLAPARNSKILTEKLELLIRNENLRKEMGKWGLKEAQKYAWPKVADRILDFYEFCRKEKEKKKKKKFSLEKSFEKIKENFEKMVKVIGV